MMLMRVYAENLHQPHQAVKILEELEKQPHVSPAHIEFARRSIDEWSHAKPKPEKIAAPPESIDELLAQGYLGTVIEILEQKIKEQPGDFDLRIKLAEVHALHCGNIHQAVKIVQRIEALPASIRNKFSMQKSNSENGGKPVRFAIKPHPGWTICLIDEAGFQFDILQLEFDI